MQIAKWSHSNAIRIPAQIVKVFKLKEGDEVNLSGADGKQLTLLTRKVRIAALERLREFRGGLPESWKFNRDKANAS